MAKIRPPVAGNNVLQWAKEATREINSLQPSAGQGQKITKTGAGTTYSVDGQYFPAPDSRPKIVAALSGPGGELERSATTYSLEKNAQNSFSLFRFGNLTSADVLRYDMNKDYGLLDFVFRDRGTEQSILSAPTVTYAPVSAVLSNLLTPGAGLGGGVPPVDLGITPDSEIVIPGGNPASYSIQHNSQNALALYHFEEMSAGDTISELDEDEDYILVRHKSGNNAPVLKYTNRLSGGGAPLSGLTEDIPVLLSVAYSTTTHQFTQTSRRLHFSNGLLISADNAVETTVFEAVEEQV